MTKRPRLLAGGLLALVLCGWVWWSRAGATVPPPPDHLVEWRFDYDGAPHLLAEGTIYRQLPSGQCVWVAQVFDPAQVARQYVQKEGQWFRRGDEGEQTYLVPEPFRSSFEDGPEGVAGLRTLIGPVVGWTELTLQSPITPNVSDYVALRKEILKQNADFRDARVEPLAAAAHTGTRGLRCTCPPPSGGMICTKASLSTGLVRFVRGETLWFQAWFRSASDMLPHTLADFECDYALQSPGLRISLGEEGFLEAELKALSKPRFKQPEDRRVAFPKREWVRVTVAASLDVLDGHVRIWQNETLVVDARGPTLPFPSGIINSLEIGVSAHSYGNQPAILDVDDITLGHTPLEGVSSPPESQTESQP
jgi:hypothetical protein